MADDRKIEAVQAWLVDEGATTEQASELVALLQGAGLDAKAIRLWIGDAKRDRDFERVNPVPDPSTIAEWGFAMSWTPINAVKNGKTDLVIEEARRFARGEGSVFPSHDDQDFEDPLLSAEPNAWNQAAQPRGLKRLFRRSR